MTSITGDRNGEGEAMGCDRFQREKRGRRQGGSTVPEANDTSKSGAAPGEAEGGG
jgi:hypothetical protein